MKIAIVLALALGCLSTAAQAQAPYIVGTWRFNAAASHLPPGPVPRVHVRRYSLTDNGTLVGLAVIVDANGDPHFLQFAAKAAGQDYAEFDSESLAGFQIDGTKPPRTYSETAIDPRTVEWADKYDGRVISSGKKWVSEDGKTLSFTVRAKNQKGEDVEYLFVFDRQ
jgi:opacity protein-like surface antigen